MEKQEIGKVFVIHCNGKPVRKKKVEEVKYLKKWRKCRKCSDEEVYIFHPQH